MGRAYEVRKASIQKTGAAKAKKEQVPSDIIKRAIDKVNSGVDESYDEVRYELFGPGGSTLIVECLTDNVNRSISSIRAALNKCNSKVGSMGSASYMYDHVCVVSFKGLDEEAVLEALLEAGVEVEDIEVEEENIVVYGSPTDLYAIKEAILKVLPKVQFDLDEITFIPKDKITLSGDDLMYFNRLITMLDEIEDVQNVYHNVEL